MQSATSLAQTISGLANNLQQTRYNADQDIGSAVANVNTDLDKLTTINAALQHASIADQPQDELLDQRDQELKDLTQYLDVGVTYNKDNSVSLYTKTTQLLSAQTGIRYHLSYTPAGSVNAFTSDQKLSSLTIIQVDANGDPTGQGTPVPLATGGKSANITTTIESGKILGLMSIRDSEVPKMLAQLDSLASGLRNAVNKINNNGVGYPPPTSLTGTRLISSDQPVGFQGTAMIAALDQNGKPAPSPYPNQPGGLTPPLTLDFSKIYGPNGIGQPTVADIENEINQYYGPPANRASMGPLADTQLVAISDNTAGPFQFDLQFNNPSTSNLNVTIVKVNGASLPAGTTVSATAGQLTRSSPGVAPFSVAVAGPGPYTIPVEVQVTDPTTGTTYDDTINYSVPAAASGLRGDRYSVNSLGGTATPPQSNATIVVPTTNQRLATAQMVDSNGNPVVNPTQPAYLQIVGNNGTTLGIDEMTSQEVGVPSSQVPATNDGFSGYFQLNDFFTQNNSTILGSSAENLAVNKSIAADPELMSVGQLSLSPQPSDPNSALYTYEVGISSNGAANALASLQEQSITFPPAGTLPKFSNTISSYASEIYAYAGGRSNLATSNLDQQNILQKSYDSQATSVSGVNLDEELANTVLYQNAYSASARIITVVNTLFGVLLQAGT